MLRNKVKYLFLLAILLVLNVLYDEYSMGILVLAAIIWLGILFLLNLYTFKLFKISLESEAHVVTKGEPFEIMIRIINRAFIPISRLQVQLGSRNKFAHAEKSETIWISINSRCEQKLSCEITSEFCGSIEFYIKKVRILDFFGIWGRRVRCKQSLEIAILPCLHIVKDNIVQENYSVLTESELFSDIRSGDDPSELFGIRGYAEGDRMNRVHWKLSLKEDKLMMKEFGLPIDCSNMLMLELNFSQSVNIMEELNGLIEAFFSMSISLLEQNKQHFLCWFEFNHKKLYRFRISKEEELYEAMSLLYTAVPYEDKNNILEQHLAEFPNEAYSNVFYLTSVWGDHLQEELMELKKNAWCHIIFIKDSENFPSSESLNQLKAEGVFVSFLSLEKLGMEIENISVLGN